jgi:hypothetical protein
VPDVIVSPRDDELVLVRQVDHQEQCALMADAWGNDDFARPEPFAPLRVATALHDEGWRAWERAPGVSDGAPTDFPHIDRSTHVALYRQGITTAVGRDLRAGLLVSLYGSGLYEGRGGLDPGPPMPRSERAPAVRDFLAEQDALQESLRARIGLREANGDWEWAAYRLLQTWDALSLYLTWRALPAGREGVLPQVPRRLGDAGVDLRLAPGGELGAVCEPWPFAGARVDLPVRARRIPRRGYPTDASLADALAGAPWLTLAYTLRPA